MKLADEVYADIPARDRAYLRWCVEEFDPTNPYHDAWIETGEDQYDTEIPTARSARLYTLTCIALMGELA